MSVLDNYLARSHGRLRGLSAGEPLPSKLHIVLGNEAADPDSCVCAIALAAALDATLGPDELVAPLVLVPRADFKLQLDRVHLLRRAKLAGEGEGAAWTPAHVSFVDELDLAALASRAPDLLALHLVDHNKLSAPLAPLAPHVASIVDHHAEESLYTDTVPEANRHVELGIGSCSSLVVERLQSLAPSLLAEPTVATLLLGALLLVSHTHVASLRIRKPPPSPTLTFFVCPRTHKNKSDAHGVGGGAARVGHDQPRRQRQGAKTPRGRRRRLAARHLRSRPRTGERRVGPRGIL